MYPIRLLSAAFTISLLILLLWLNANTLTSKLAFTPPTTSPSTFSTHSPPSKPYPIPSSISVLPQPEPDYWYQTSTDYTPSPSLPPPDTDEYMAACMCVKDQSIDLPEFLIHHYYHLGIRRFYVWDDGTDTPLSEHADYGIPSSAITFIYIPYKREEHIEGHQESIYGDCVRRFGHKHTWMGFIDVDEFIEMTGNETLKEFLQSFEEDNKIAAVAMQWKMHNSNNMLTRQESVRRAFTSCLTDSDDNDNSGIKSWAKMALYDRQENLHFVISKDNENGEATHEVGELGDGPIVGVKRSPITRHRIALHHYGVKSKQEFEEKQVRGKPRGGSAATEWWEFIESWERFECREMAGYRP